MREYAYLIYSHSQCETRMDPELQLVLLVSVILARKKPHLLFWKTQHTKIGNVPTISPIPTHTHTPPTCPPIESTRSLGQGKRFSFYPWDRKRSNVWSSKNSSKMTVSYTYLHCLEVPCQKIKPAFIKRLIKVLVAKNLFLVHSSSCSNNRPV